MPFARALPCVFILLAFSMPVIAATMAPTKPSDPPAAVQVMRVAPGSIRLDGKLDDAAWQGAPPLSEFWEIGPGDRATPKVRTEARFAHDGKFLFVAVTAYDPDLAQLRAPFALRDDVRRDQDFIALFIDPLGARKFSQFVRVNPRGVIADGLHNEDTGNEDFSPDFDVEVVTGRAEGAWTVELAIPFSSLRYANPPAQAWSALVFRNYPREQRYRIASSPLPRDSNCFICLNRALTGMAGIDRGVQLTLTPTLTLRQATDRVEGSARVRLREGIAGIDMKLRPRSDIVVDATLNPDFSQVELDAPQLASNAQFALFFPEKRPFFLEGADLFESPLNAIYTRSITDPAWGLRVTKRDDDRNLTVLLAKDDGKGLVLLPQALGTGFAEQNFTSIATIVRGRYNLGSVTLGSLFTDRTIESGGGYNRVFGGDVVWKPSVEDRFRVQLLGSATTARFGASDLPKSDHAAVIDASHIGERWNLFASYTDIGRGFRADNGFISQAGVRGLNGEVRRKFFNVGPFNELSPYLNVEYKTTPEGIVVYQQAHSGVSLGLPRDTFIWIEPRKGDRVRSQTTGPTLARDQLFIGFESVPFPWLAKVGGELALGERFDVGNNRIGDGYYINFNAKVRPADRLEVEYRIDESVIRAKGEVLGGDRILNERAQRLFGVLHLTARDNLRLIYQTTFTKRAPSLWLNPVAAYERQETLSLTYAHRRSIGTTFYAGVTASDLREPDSVYRRRQLELFAKASSAWSL
jgi:hypothetical protein